jgi:hypothetical protein
MLDAAIEVRETISKYGVTGTTIAALTPIAGPKLSQILNGSITPSIEESQNLFRVCAKVREITEIFGGVPLDWRKVDRIKNLFDRLDRGSLYVKIVESDSM